MIPCLVRRRYDAELPGRSSHVSFSSRAGADAPEVQQAQSRELFLTSVACRIQSTKEMVAPGCDDVLRTSCSTINKQFVSEHVDAQRALSIHL